jgi:hypothetical protein
MASLTETRPAERTTTGNRNPHPIAHLDITGSGIAACGKHLSGEPAPDGCERCVVCSAHEAQG